MKRLLRYFVLLTTLVCVTDSALSQTPAYKELHKVKRKETIFGIARENGLTIEELIKANPEMNTPGYELKKGDYIKIPYPAAATPSAAEGSQGTPKMAQMPVRVATKENKDVRQREVRIGVMLPLHNINGDGRRMAEYYRGVLMACDSLKANGISTDIRAWNVPEDGDIRQVLKDPHAADRDLIIGPLYTKQLKALGDFALSHDIRVLIPFSINSTTIPTSFRSTRTATRSTKPMCSASSNASRTATPSSSTAKTRRARRAPSPVPCAASWSRRA